MATFNPETQLIVSIPIETAKQLDIHTGEKYVFTYKLPLFHQVDLRSAIEEKLNDTPGRMFSVDEIQTIGDSLKVYTTVVSHNTPFITIYSVLLVGITFTSLSVLALLFNFSLDKIEKIVDKPATVIASTGILLGAIASLLYIITRE